MMFLLFKKDFQISSHGNVEMANGTVQFQAVKLNVYTFFTDGMLIDTGSYSLRKQFKPFFQSLPIEKVVLTHFHEDHTGNAYLFNERYIPIYMHDLMRESCEQKATYPLYRKLFWGKRPSFKATPITNHFVTEHSSWRTIHTPGHAADHVCYYNETTGQLFTGDLYVTPKTKLILRDESIPQIMRSIETILPLHIEEMYCNHAGFVKDGKQALTRKLDYLKEIEEKVISLHDEGRSVEEITSILYPKKFPIITLSGGEWDSQHIVTSILKERVQV